MSLFLVTKTCIEPLSIFIYNESSVSNSVLKIESIKIVDAWI